MAHTPRSSLERNEEATGPQIRHARRISSLQHDITAEMERGVFHHRKLSKNLSSPTSGTARHCQAHRSRPVVKVPLPAILPPGGSVPGKRKKEKKKKEKERERKGTQRTCCRGLRCSVGRERFPCCGASVSQPAFGGDAREKNTHVQAKFGMDSSVRIC